VPDVRLDGLVECLSGGQGRPDAAGQLVERAFGAVVRVGKLHGAAAGVAQDEDQRAAVADDGDVQAAGDFGGVEVPGDAHGVERAGRLVEDLLRDDALVGAREQRDREDAVLAPRSGLAGLASLLVPAAEPGEDLVEVVPRL
jgi:hypothetical protein